MKEEQAEERFTKWWEANAGIFVAEQEKASEVALHKAIARAGYMNGYLAALLDVENDRV